MVLSSEGIERQGGKGRRGREGDRDDGGDILTRVARRSGN
jgi:hypothetical protein